MPSLTPAGLLDNFRFVHIMLPRRKLRGDAGDNDFNCFFEASLYRQQCLCVRVCLREVFFFDGVPERNGGLQKWIIPANLKDSIAKGLKAYF